MIIGPILNGFPNTTKSLFWIILSWIADEDIPIKNTDSHIGDQDPGITSKVLYCLLIAD